MTESDVLYRAFGELFGALEKDGGVAKTLEAAVKAPEFAKITVSHNVCKVEEDWIAAIERGLVYVGRAIDEDRQFIRSEGEVKAIEKVKKISRESVQHLSRHSDLITRKQEEEDIVPDKLYTVERDSDYAVYENRFLYLLLCKIRDFVSVRFEAINSAYREYRGEYETEKNVTTATRRLSFSIKISDEQSDVASAAADKRCAEALERMDKILQSVSFYLRTPIMTEVSHSPKIRGNITKTNVLMMNKNFHEALGLYEYLTAYEGDGYTVEKTVDVLDPVPQEFLRELSVPPLLIAFLTYEHGLGLEEYLKNEYLKEEERLREEASLALQRRIAELKKKIENSGGNAEEYMLALEERIAELEKNLPLLAAARVENEQLKGRIMRLEEERKVLFAEIEELKKDIDRLKEDMQRAEEEHRLELIRVRDEYEEKAEQIKREYEEQIAEIRRQEEQNIAALTERYEQQISDIKDGYVAEITRIKYNHGEEIAAVNRAYAERLRASEEGFAREIERVKVEWQGRAVSAEEKIKSDECERKNKAAELAAVKDKLELAVKERDLYEARLTAIRREYGLLTAADDFTTEEGFDALEHEFETLGKLMREEWTEVTKLLKKDFYAGLREAMRTKKKQKTREYRELGAKVRERKRSENPDESAEEDGE